MICVYNSFTEPCFNLAAEEYLLHHFQDDVFMLWQNKPSVVVGKYQNTNAEINLEFIRKNQISVVRRITGGGAVYHDLGNLNFTFIEKSESGNYSKFNEQILDFLIRLGVNAQMDVRHNLLIDGLKISGCAQCIHHGRIMHHGTLLFSSILSDLEAALQSGTDDSEKRYVQSVRSPVTNINQHLDSSMDIQIFKDLLMFHLMKDEKEKKIYQFSETDIQAIRKLSEEKYTRNDWNFGNPFRKSGSPQLT